ncbi:Aste57867_8409 [Aphanomyces stellatus]|uniref:Aste57867_8409 protein n=1 Tax=Aphanomyces stellatus TaxID=120398 RepID=A0A485KK78_9STRA|nr:hypothetical protein As57867_008377 [Aphanomyces stellatus]VFT85295.1 Aste57867_8409 [Aphanomyces stellatus]
MPELNPGPKLILPGRLRVIGMLPNGVLDPHKTNSFPAFIAPDLMSAEKYLKTQPMGSYLFVYAPSRSKSLWRKAPPSDFSLSIIVKYRSRMQMARLPIAWKRSKWFSHAKPAAFIDWNQGQVHVAYVDPAIFPVLKAFWTDFMLYVGEKIDEICQDPCLDENWKPSNSAGGYKVRVLSHAVHDGISVDVLHKKAVSVCFNFDHCSIDVHFGSRNMPMKTWRIRFPWNITFAAIKEAALQEGTPILPKTSLTSFHFPITLPQGSKLYYIQSAIENDEEHVEMDLLQALVERIDSYDATKELSLRDIIHTLLRCPLDSTTGPKLLTLRVETTTFLLALQSLDPKAPHFCSKATVERSSAYVVHLARQFDVGSVSAEKLAQLVHIAIENNRDLGYLLSLFLSLLDIPSFCVAYAKNNGASALWSRYARIIDEDRASPNEQAGCKYRKETLSLQKPIAKLEIVNPKLALEMRAKEAGERYCLHSVSFVHDEYARRKNTTPKPRRLPSPAYKELCPAILIPRLKTTFVKTPPEAPCSVCASTLKQHALLLMEGNEKLRDLTRAYEDQKDVASVASVHLQASELAYWERQPDSCWRRLFTFQWQMVFDDRIRRIHKHGVDDHMSILDLVYLQSLVERLQQQNLDGAAFLSILCQLLAFSPARLDERQPKEEFANNFISKFVETAFLEVAKVDAVEASSTLAHSWLELWRLLLLSIGRRTTQLEVLYEFVCFFPSFELVKSFGNRISESLKCDVGQSAIAHEDYLDWLRASVGVILSLSTNDARNALIDQTICPKWLRSLRVLECPDPLGGYENVYNKVIQAFTKLLPETFGQLNSPVVLSAMKEYVWVVCSSPRFNADKLYWHHFIRFLECYYLAENHESIMLHWDCLYMLSFQVQSDLLEFFVLYQLFPFTYASKKLAARMEAQLLDKWRRNADQLSPENSSPMPLLQLHKVPSMRLNLSPLLVETNINKDPMEELNHSCHPSFFVQFVLGLLDILISKIDDQSLNSHYCGRFGGPKCNGMGLDVLYWFQKLFDSEMGQNNVSEVSSKIGANNSKRLESKLRLFKLAVLSLSERVIFFRGFDPPRQGAFGTIYKCTSDMPLFRSHAECSRQSIALKIIEPQKFPHERSILHAVYYEVAILEQLRGNSAAIQIYDYGLSKQGFFIAMEYATMSLKGWRELHVSKLDVQTILAIFAKICLAVAQLHAASIAHFDIKCENVLVRNGNLSEFDVCMGDFGESFLNTAVENEVLSCSYSRGTEAIKSPEMLNFSHSAGYASDVWSLGCLLYELVTGSLMFEKEEWPTLFAHLTKSTAPVLTKQLDEKLQQSLMSFNATSDQCLLVSDLLTFILVRQVDQRPSLGDVQVKLTHFKLNTAPPVEAFFRPALTPSDSMHQQVRLLDVHKPDRYDKIKLSSRLYIGCRPDWAGEIRILVRHQKTPLEALCIVVTPPQSSSLEKQEEFYALQLLKQSKPICQMLWEVYMSKREALLDVPSQELLRALMPVIYVYHMAYFGTSCFELVKRNWKPLDASLIPSISVLASILCWEEKRCAVRNAAYQVLVSAERMRFGLEDQSIRAAPHLALFAHFAIRFLLSSP